MEIYTDASVDDRRGVGACAYIIMENDVIIVNEVVLIGEVNGSLICEVYAIRLALEYVLKSGLKPKNIKIFTDHKDILRAKPGSKLIKLFSHHVGGLRSKMGVMGIHTHLFSINGHSGHPHNDRVDRNARAALKEYIKKNPRTKPETSKK